MNHIVIGAGIPFLIGLTIYWVRGARADMKLLVALPLFMAAGAWWAILPDFPLLWGDMAWYLRAHRSPWIDVFFWHGTIDRIEKEMDLAPWNLLAMILMMAALLAVAWRELYRRETHAGRRASAGSVTGFVAKKPEQAQRRG